MFVDQVPLWKNLQEELLAEELYVLSGGTDIETGEVIFPFNCGVFLFKVMKQFLAHSKCRFKDEDFIAEFFRASPPIALALLVEQRFGRDVASIDYGILNIMDILEEKTTLAEPVKKEALKCLKSIKFFLERGLSPTDFKSKFCQSLIQKIDMLIKENQHILKKEEHEPSFELV